MLSTGFLLEFLDSDQVPVNKFNSVNINKLLLFFYVTMRGTLSRRGSGGGPTRFCSSTFSPPQSVAVWAGLGTPGGRNESSFTWRRRSPPRPAGGATQSECTCRHLLRRSATVACFCPWAGLIVLCNTKKHFVRLRKKRKAKSQTFLWEISQNEKPTRGPTADDPECLNEAKGHHRRKTDEEEAGRRKDLEPRGACWRVQTRAVSGPETSRTSSRRRPGTGCRRTRPPGGHFADSFFPKVKPKYSRSGSEVPRGDSSAS